MPRRSAASFSVVELPVATRLSPPTNLTKIEVELFRNIIRAIDPKHFVPSDAPLLGRYCKNLALANTASGHIEREGAVNTETGKISPWVSVAEKADRAVATLSAKLRLAPSSRFDQATAHRRTNINQPSYYDEADDA